jgi:Na+/H+ antiporter NhaA
MTREHDISSLVRRLRPDPVRLAAATAVYDPGALLALQAARRRGERTDAPCRRGGPPRVRRMLSGESGAALLLVAAVAIALLWSNSPWRGTYAAFWHAPVALTVGPWTVGADLRTWVDEGVMPLFFLVVGFRRRGDSTAVLTPLSVLVGVALWLALFESGIDPVVSGLLVGLLTNANPPPASSPNDRIRHRLHPLTSAVVVPVFALANAGVHLDGQLLSEAARSPVTWGIVLAYVVGKPVGIVAAAAGRGLGRAELRGTALSAGVGFTVSLLIASRAFDGALLEQAKVGILATALLAPVLAAVALARLPRAAHMRAASPCAAR